MLTWTHITITMTVTVSTTTINVTATTVPTITTLVSTVTVTSRVLASRLQALRTPPWQPWGAASIVPT